jgi:hypothetical protein
MSILKGDHVLGCNGAEEFQQKNIVWWNLHNHRSVYKFLYSLNLGITEFLGLSIMFLGPQMKITFCMILLFLLMWYCFMWLTFIGGWLN